MPDNNIYSFDADYEKIAIPLYEWKPVHSAAVVSLPDGSLVFNEQSNWDWHLLRLSRAEFFSLISLRIVAEPLPGCDAELYVNHWGGIDVCRVSSDGVVLDAEYCQDIKAQKLPDGSIEVIAKFLNAHETISVGTSRGQSGRYQGASRDQYVFKSIEVYVADLNALPPDREIVFVDVGARYGLQPEWSGLRNIIKPILFEPDPEEAEVLRQQLAMKTPWAPEAIVVASALSNKKGKETLYITRHPGCSSLLEPNVDVLGRYHIAPAFEVMRKIEVYCERYDSLF